jgi:hypothetical protein
MADVTTPTNTLVIRPDKMAMLTERDRIPDRLERLERAIRDGVAGSGGGTIVDTGWYTTAYGVATAAATGWKLTPIHPDASFVKTGDAAAFTRNANGSLTIRDAGTYVINAVVQCPSPATAENHGAILQKGISEAASDPSTFLTQGAMVTGSTTYVPLSWNGYLPAGQVISIVSYTVSSQARQMLHFEIARTGAGLTGAPGAPGAAGATGPSSAVVQANAPSPRGEVVLWIDTDDVPPPAGIIPVVSTLPSSPTDGQEVYYQNAAMALQGVVWHLKFRDTMGLTFYQWEYLGGGPLFDVIVAQQATNSTSYVDLATVGPSVPLPLSGDYIVEWGADVQEYSTAQYMGIGVWNGSTWTQFGNPMYGQVAATGISGVRASRSKATKMTGLVGGAANSIRARYANSAATNLAWGDRWLKVTPVRVN